MCELNDAIAVASDNTLPDRASSEDSLAELAELGNRLAFKVRGMDDYGAYELPAGKRKLDPYFGDDTDGGVGDRGAKHIGQGNDAAANMRYVFIALADDDARENRDHGQHARGKREQ